MTGGAFVDTSAWYALANRADPDHGAVREALGSREGALVVSNYVVDETLTLCRMRLGHDAAVRVGVELRSGGVADLVRASIADEHAAWSIFAERSDRRYSFTDCVSFAMMRRLGLVTAVALDADFRREGFAVLPADQLPD